MNLLPLQLWLAILPLGIGSFQHALHYDHSVKHAGSCQSPKVESPTTQLQVLMELPFSVEGTLVLVVLIPLGRGVLTSITLPLECGAALSCRREHPDLLWPTHHFSTLLVLVVGKEQTGSPAQCSVSWHDCELSHFRNKNQAN